MKSCTLTNNYQLPVKSSNRFVKRVKNSRRSKPLLVNRRCPLDPRDRHHHAIPNKRNAQSSSLLPTEHQPEDQLHQTLGLRLTVLQYPPDHHQTALQDLLDHHQVEPLVLLGRHLAVPLALPGHLNEHQDHLIVWEDRTTRGVIGVMMTDTTDMTAVAKSRHPQAIVKEDRQLALREVVEMAVAILKTSIVAVVGILVTETAETVGIVTREATNVVTIVEMIAVVRVAPVVMTHLVLTATTEKRAPVDSTIAVTHHVIDSTIVRRLEQTVSVIASTALKIRIQTPAHVMLLRPEIELLHLMLKPTAHKTHA